MSRRMLALGSAATAVALAATAVAVLNEPKGPESSIAPTILTAPDGSVLAAGLVQAVSCEDLGATMRTLSEEYGTGMYGYGTGGWFGNGRAFATDDMAVMDGGVDMGAPAPMAGSTTATAGGEASADFGEESAAIAPTDGDGTNVQEVGVDEPDIVERVGDLIVVGTEGMLRVLSVEDGVPTERGTIELQRWGGDLGLFAVGDDRVAVVGNGDGEVPVRDATGDRAMIRPSGGSTTEVTLIDLSDPDAPEQLSSVELEGWMVDARAVDGVLRLAVRADGPQIDVYAQGDFAADREMDWENATDADYRAYDEAIQEEYETRMDAAYDLIEPEDWQPHMRVTDAAGNATVEPLVGCDRIGFPTSFAGLGTLTLAVIDATGDTLAVDDAEAVVTSGENLYATTDRVVIATTRWEPCCEDVPTDGVIEEEPPLDPFFDEDEGPAPAPEELPVEPDAPDAIDELEDAPADEPVEEPGDPSLAPSAEAQVLPMIEPGGFGRGMPWGWGGGTTDLHVFDVDGAVVTHITSGAVDGTLLNQYSMSIHDGVLRVATTGSDDDGVSESFVTTLRVEGDDLVQLGQVGGLGRNETIQAVRFMGDVGYVVTFRRTDPLYVIDLSDPAAPKAVGELKIEGYSAYLHPINTGQLLGVGQDADPETGQTRGVQVSTFDVTDMTKPVRIDVDVTPDSSSEVEWDPHALTVAQGNRVIIPIEIWSPTQRLGALVYDVQADGTLVDVGLLDAGTRYELRPRRTVDLDGFLLTVGDRGAIVWDRDSLKPLADVSFTAPSWGEERYYEDDVDFGGTEVEPQPAPAVDVDGMSEEELRDLEAELKAREEESSAGSSGEDAP